MLMRHLSATEITEYLDGVLPMPQVPRAEGHLRHCVRCSATVAGLRDAMRALTQLETKSAPEDLRQRVAAAVAAAPVPALTCAEAAPLLHEHVDGELPTDMVRVVQHHLQGCRECRAELVALFTATRLVRSLTPATPPPGVGERVREAARLASRGRARRLGPHPVLRPALVAVGSVGLAYLLFAVSPMLRNEGTMAGPPSIATLEPGAVAPAPQEPDEQGPAAPEVRPQPAVVAEASTAVEPAVRSRSAERASGPAERPLRVVSARAVAAAATGRSAVEEPAALPAAVRTLQAIATAAASDRAGRRATDMASERFAILDSEAAWGSVPEANVATPGGNSGVRGEPSEASSSPSNVRPGTLTPGAAGRGNAREAEAPGSRLPLV
jgi:anti-sigma factor RsiW